MIDRANYNTFNLENNLQSLKGTYTLLEWKYVTGYPYDGMYVRYGQQTNWTWLGASVDTMSWNYEQVRITVLNVLNLAQVEERTQLLNNPATEDAIRQRGRNDAEVLSIAFQPNLPPLVIWKLGSFFARLSGYDNADMRDAYVDGFMSQFNVVSPSSMQITAKKGE